MKKSSQFFVLAMSAALFFACDSGSHKAPHGEEKHEVSHGEEKHDASHGDHGEEKHDASHGEDKSHSGGH